MYSWKIVALYHLDSSQAEGNNRRAILTYLMEVKTLVTKALLTLNVNHSKCRARADNSCQSIKTKMSKVRKLFKPNERPTVHRMKFKLLDSNG